MSASLTTGSESGAASRAALEQVGRRRIVEDSRGTYRSGRELAERVRGVAGAIQAAGLSPRVGLWYWNSIPALEAHLAVEWLGGTRVPLDPSAPPDEARAVFQAAGVDVVLADQRHAVSLVGALVHDEATVLDEGGHFRPVPYEPLRTHLLYPRMAASGALFAVPVSYANWDATMRINQSLYLAGGYGPDFGPDERFLTVQQMLHGTGFLGTFPFLLMGLPQVILEQFSAGATLEAIRRFEPTATFMVPGMVTRLANEVTTTEDKSTKSLRRLLYGGATFGLDDMTAAMRVLGTVLVQVYGRVEGGWPLAVLGHDDHARIAAGDISLARSFGRPISDVEVRLRHVEGEDRNVGELCVRSEMSVSEYSDPDGWCALGDIVTQDDHGYLTYVRRLDGMINTGSYHVYPKEVEAAIGAVAGVSSVVVVAEPDTKWGQRVVAYVVAEPEVRDTIEQRIADELSQRLARYKHPKAIYIVDLLPELNPSTPRSV